MRRWPVGLVSRSRVTQMTSLLILAPDIQEEILFLGVEEAEQFRISEPSLRKLTATLVWKQQREQWKNLRRPAIRSKILEQAREERHPMTTPDDASSEVL
jgi:hypothetical protein